MLKIRPLQAGDEAIVIFHNASSVISNTKEEIIDIIQKNDIKTYCQNYQNLNKEAIFKDGQPVPNYFSFFCDHPQNIADDIIWALQNPKIRLMVFPLGGNGMTEIVDIIEERRHLEPLPYRDDIFFIGFSDTEKITNYLSSIGLGQAITASRVTGTKLQDLLNLLMEDNSRSQNIFSVNKAARQTKLIEGILLSGAAEEHHESYNRVEPSFEGDILFLEDFPAPFETSLEFYAVNGMLDQVKAIVLSMNFFIGKIKMIINHAEKIFNEYNLPQIPIFYGIKCGHQLAPDCQLPLPLRTKAVISKKEDGQFQITISNLREIDNIKKVALEHQKRPSFVRRQLNPIPPGHRMSVLDKDRIFCHTVNTAHGQRAEPVKDVLEAASRPISLVLNLPDFSDFAHIPKIQWFDNLSEAEKRNFIEHDMIKSMQICLMDLKNCGYSNKISDITLCARHEFSAEIKGWMADFMPRMLRGIPYHLIVTPNLHHPHEIRIREEIAKEEQQVQKSLTFTTQQNQASANIQAQI